MKTLNPVCLLILIGITNNLLAQSGQPLLPAHAPGIPSTGQSVLSEQLVVGERGPDHRAWLKVTTARDADGHLSTQTNTSFVELATGLHYRQDGRWLETRAEIEPGPLGAVARHGSHKAVFACDLSGPVIVDLEAPGGWHLRSRVLGMAYLDAASGKTVWISELRNSKGSILGRNQVLYPDAFTDFRADLRYTYTQSGFEQDVVLRQRPPSPELFGFNPATTRLQVLTEFFDAPEPAVRVGQVHGGDQKARPDETLTFDGLRIGYGKAFLEGVDGSRGLAFGGATSEQGAAVSKQWLKLEGRQVLVEELPLSDLQSEFDSLPAATGDYPRPGVSGALRVASVTRPLPPPRTEVRIDRPGPMEFARATDSSPGVVMDYHVTLTGSLNNYVFAGNLTYYVSGAVQLNGNTTLEGGAVIKYNNTNTASLSVWGPIKTVSDMYRPVVFTSKFDNSVGDSVATGTPVISGGSALYIFPPSAGLNIELSNLRFSYATVGFDVGSDQGGIVTLRNAQFVKCGIAVKLGGYYNYPQVKVYNGLIHDGTTAFHRWYGGSATAQNLTVNKVTNLDTAESAPGIYLTLVNSLLVEIASVSPFSGSPNANQSGQTGTGIFASVGAGKHYLTNDTYRNGGTTAIDTQLLGELATMTTYAPQTLSSAISATTYLGIQAPRDTDAPDFGYHYAPLDYLFNQINLSARLTLGVGVSVGVQGAYALNLLNNSAVNSLGAPAALNHMARYSAVQEQPLSLGVGVLFQSIGEAYGDLNFRFADLISGQGNLGYLVSFSGAMPYANFTLRDSQLRGAYWSVLLTSAYWFPPVNLALNNNLIDRSVIYFYQRYYYQDTFVIVNAYNNLFRNSSFNLTYYYNDTDYEQNPSWIVRDNLFDATSQSISGVDWEGYITCSHNAFITNCTDNLGGSFNKPNRLSDYQIGPRGTFYYPATGAPTSLASLINAGSRTSAAAGLSNYTVLTNESPDTSTVDIGYHYRTNAVFTDTTGKDFWVAFGNTRQGGRGGPAMRLLITGSSSATSGNVSVPGLSFSQNFSLASGLTQIIDLPDSFTESASTMITLMDLIQNKGVHVTSSEPVTVRGLNNDDAISEAFLALPTHMLGTNYCLMARASLEPSSALWRSQFAIVAVSATTVVTIKPSATANLTGHPGTTQFQKTLNQGQTYQLNSADSDSDVTGTIVTSDKPMAIVSGSSFSWVPTPGVGAPNPLVEEQLPIETWARQVFRIPLADRHNGATYRILAANNNTVVTRNGAAFATLQKGQVQEEVTTDSQGVEFRASQPIQVAEFSHGNEGTSVAGILGDPFMTLLPPTGRYLNTYRVASVEGVNHQFTNFLNIVAEPSAVSSTFVDDVLVTGFRPVTANSGYRLAQVRVPPGTHVVRSSRPIGVQAYGFVQSYDAYGYNAGQNHYPIVAVPDFTNAPLVGAIVLDVMANDIIVNKSAVAISVVGAPAHGTAVTNANRDILFTPNGSFTGTDQFTYQIIEQDNVATAVVTIWINNSAPVAGTDNVVGPSDTPLVINVLANDTDPNSDPLFVLSVSAPSLGTAIISNNLVVYTHLVPFDYTPDSFTYKVTDGRGGVATGTVNINFDDPPTANADSLSLFQGQAGDVDVLFNDSDPNPNSPPPTLVSAANGAHGTVTINPNHTVHYVPNDPDFTGSDQFDYVIEDATHHTAVGTVFVQITNPVSTGDDFESTDPGVPVVVQVISTDFDASGGNLFVDSVTDGTYGSVSIDAGGLSVTYTPYQGSANVSDFFTYVASDGTWHATGNVFVFIDP